MIFTEIWTKVHSTDELQCQGILCVDGHISVVTGGGKGKAHPTTGHEGPEGKWRYSYTVSVTTPRPSLFTPREGTRYPLYRRPGSPHGLFARVRNISPPPGFDPRTAQPVANRCTDYSISTQREGKQGNVSTFRCLVTAQGCHSDVSFLSYSKIFN
jgi:hypothetical protein